MALTDTVKDYVNKMCPSAKTANLGNLIDGMAISGNIVNTDGSAVEGSWRFAIASNSEDVEIQRYESGAWVMKQTITK